MEFDGIFRAYDVRGKYPSELSVAKAKRIAQAYARFTQPKIVAVGRDVRQSSESLQKAVMEGLSEAGVQVADIGAVPTELLYFAVGNYQYDGGIQVTASHNPAEFNGMKFVRHGVEPIGVDSGLLEIKTIAESGQELGAPLAGEIHRKEILEDYLDFLTHFAAFEKVRPLKIVANNNYGLSGIIFQQLLQRLATDQVQLVELNFSPDGTFPKGPPNPNNPTVQRETSELIREAKADLGVVWDGDGDRCYIVDERGEFISGCHLTALLAKYLIQKNGGGKIVYEPRNIWAIEDSVKSTGGELALSRAGHVFFKEKMREQEALFGGESSGHFYFRDFFDADSGIIPLVLFLNILSEVSHPVSEVVKPLRDKYYSSGEINFSAENKQHVIDKVAAEFPNETKDETDGLSINADSWRFNLRASNTEDLLRLNVEAHDASTLKEKTEELKALLETH